MPRGGAPLLALLALNFFLTLIAHLLTEEDVYDPRA